MTSLNQPSSARNGSPRETAAGVVGTGSSSSQGAAPAAVSGGRRRAAPLGRRRQGARHSDRLDPHTEGLDVLAEPQPERACGGRRLLPDCAARRALTTAGRAAKECFDRDARR